MFHKNTKHIDVKHHFACVVIIGGLVKLEKTASKKSSRKVEQNQFQFSSQVRLGLDLVFIVPKAQKGILVEEMLENKYLTLDAIRYK